MAYIATGDDNYLEGISKAAQYVQQSEINGSPVSCIGFHMQSIFVRNLGHYLFFRDQAYLE